MRLEMGHNLLGIEGEIACKFFIISNLPCTEGNLTVQYTFLVVIDRGHTRELHC